MTCGLNTGGDQLWWWDGPERYQYTNRCVVSTIQKDLFYQMISIFIQGIGIDIGSGSNKFENILSIDIRSPCSIISRGEILPIKNGSISYILSSHAMEHIPNIEETLKEWLRVLKHGGIIGSIIPDRRHFLHDESVIKDGDVARNEVNPDEMMAILKRLPNIKILSFDTRKNNFDFEFLIRKE